MPGNGEFVVVRVGDGQSPWLEGLREVDTAAEVRASCQGDGESPRQNEINVRCNSEGSNSHCSCFLELAWPRIRPACSGFVSH